MLTCACHCAVTASHCNSDTGTCARPCNSDHRLSDYYLIALPSTLSIVIVCVYHGNLLITKGALMRDIKDFGLA